MKKILLFLIPFWMWVSVGTPSLHAEDLYIAQTAAGGATGANCANALVYTFFNSSGNWGAGAGKISAGDTVHICGTISGPGTNMNALTAQGSGTAGNVITIHFESGAKMSNPAWPDSPPGALDLPDNTAYITVEGNGACGWINLVEVPCTEGFEDTANGFGLANDQPSAGIYGRPVSHVTVKNLYFRNFYVQPRDPNSAGHKHDVGDAVHLGGDSNLIENLEMHDEFAGATIDYYSGSTNAEIKNVYGYNLNWGIIGSGHQNNAHMNGFLVHDNEIRDWQNWDDDAGNCCHHNGVFFQEQGATGTGIDGLQIYRNYFHGDTGDRMTGEIFLDCENAPSYCYPSAQIFNNIFQAGTHGPSDGLISVGSGPTYSVSILSNTFSTLVGGTCIDAGGSGNSRLTIKNNVLSGCSTTYFMGCSVCSGAQIVASDYNSFFGQTDLANIKDLPATYHTLATWQAASIVYYGGAGMDGHSISSSPNFSSSTFIPNSGSPLIGAAVNLTSLGVTALDSDYYSVARPGGSTAWDIGMAQFATTPAAVSLSPTSYAFGSQTINTTSGTQLFTLTNSGGTTLNITSIAKGGTDTTKFNLASSGGGSCGTGSSTLGAGLNCTFTVSFTPTAVTSYSANVAVTSDASTSPDTVTLTGSGVSAGASSPSGISGGIKLQGGTIQ